MDGVNGMERGKVGRSEWRGNEREADESAQRESEEREVGLGRERDLRERIRSRGEVAGTLVAIINNTPWRKKCKTNAIKAG